MSDRLRTILWIATHPAAVLRVIEAVAHEMGADFDWGGSCAGEAGNGQGMNQAMGWVIGLLERRASLPRSTPFDGMSRGDDVPF